LTHETDADGGYTDDPMQAAPKKRSKFLIFFLLAVSLIGGTSALQISLGTGSIEFGQYVRVVTACDDFIQIQGVAGTETEIEKVKIINVNGLDTQSCNGKTITIKAYTTGNAAALNLYSYTFGDNLNSVDNLSLKVVNEVLELNNVPTPNDSSSSRTISFNSGTGVYSVTFATPIATVGSVNTWTLQTSHP
jgi:hypothetical protein